jgi:Fe2+ transport system protein FeoA
MEMGLVNGETVLVERVAPLGDPVEFLVKGYHLSLRRSDARHIAVQLLADTPGDDQ